MSAPQLFHDDDEGYGQVLGDGGVTAEHADDARHAAAICPEHAITASA
jgi:ferredoxin